MQKLSKWTCHKHSENNNISNRLNVSNCSCSWSVSTHFVGYQVCTSDLEHILTVFAILSTNPSNPLFSFYTTDIYADAVQSKKEAEGHTEHFVCPILQGKKSVNCDNYSFCEYLLCFSWPGRRHYLVFFSFFFPSVTVHSLVSTLSSFCHTNKSHSLLYNSPLRMWLWCLCLTL